MYFYAGSTNCFYTEGSDVPSDAVEITDERYQELIAGTAEGLIIVADSAGYPEFYVQTAEQNKATASALLSASDWTTIPDVANPINDPYLANQNAFIVYRSEVRKIAVTPVAGNLVWATAPTEEWIWATVEEVPPTPELPIAPTEEVPPTV
jgi:hypothetical protein